MHRVNAATQEVERLTAEVERLTGKPPESRDPKYLKRRLAQLRKPAIVGVSMTQVQHAALHDVEKREGGGVAALVRRALASYFAHCGYDEAAAFEAEARHG